MTKHYTSEAMIIDIVTEVTETLEINILQQLISVVIEAWAAIEANYERIKNDNNINKYYCNSLSEEYSCTSQDNSIELSGDESSSF